MHVAGHAGVQGMMPVSAVQAGSAAKAQMQAIAAASWAAVTVHALLWVVACLSVMRLLWTWKPTCSLKHNHKGT
jgi:hypothetical protein